jgi:hypothetical protein
MQALLILKTGHGRFAMHLNSLFGKHWKIEYF